MILHFASAQARSKEPPQGIDLQAAIEMMAILQEINKMLTEMTTQTGLYHPAVFSGTESKQLPTIPVRGPAPVGSGTEINPFGSGTER